MGDPKRPRKKYSKPGHPWQKLRIEEEALLKKKYGYKNKTELWKMTSELRRLRAQARKLIAGITEQAEKEKKQLLEALYKKGLLEKGATLDDVLGLKLENIMDRRLQTILFKKQISNTIKHSRQLITHKKVIVDGRVVVSPSYIVKKDEESKIKVNN